MRSISDAAIADDRGTTTEMPLARGAMTSAAPAALRRDEGGVAGSGDGTAVSGSTGIVIPDNDVSSRPG